MQRLLLLILLLPSFAPAQGTQADYDRARNLQRASRGKVFRDHVEPNWFDHGSKFWYRVDLPDKQREFILVDAEQGKRTVIAEKDVPKADLTPARTPNSPRSRRTENRPASPDGKWVAFLKDHNVWLRNTESKKERKLSEDGTTKDAYNGRFFWSPDSRKLIAIRSTPGGTRRVTLVESSPRDQLQPKVSSYFYLKPGDEIPLAKPHLFDIEKNTQIPVPDTLFPNPWDIGHEHWTPDSKRFLFFYNQRGHGIVRVITVNAETGHAEAIVNEECKTFFDYANKLYLRYLDDTNELLWMSERSGWNHLYLIDWNTGRVKNAVTSGEWVLRNVERVDEENREITFRAMGYDAAQDPYYLHYFRVGFDGNGLVRLTQADGTHMVRFSPDRKYYLDSFSRVDLPPVTELHRTSDGKRVLTLENADDSRLRQTGWRHPERFVAKGRDGRTDIHGIILRPTHFDPKKEYHVIEYIYAGPHNFFVPKSFTSYSSRQQMAELGFIVVQIDGMGTNWRSKAFHDVCWKNLGDSGFPDRIRWIRAAAKKYPEMNITNGIGIYGGSAGGQSTVRGMTEYPDFYRVGVADCGCHDNRMDKIWWNELWMGWPVGPHYKEQSNVTNAHKITGHLMLVVGELDRNVDPSSTMQVVNALIQADRDFDLLVIPGAGHGAAETPYGRRRRKDFFVRHLMGVEPRAKPATMK